MPQSERIKNMQIRRLTIEDVETFADFTERYTEMGYDDAYNFFLECLEQPSFFALGAFSNDGLIGCIDAEIAPDTDHLNGIGTTLVKPDRRGEGIGFRLKKTALALLDTLSMSDTFALVVDPSGTTEDINSRLGFVVTNRYGGITTMKRPPLAGIDQTTTDFDDQQLAL